MKLFAQVAARTAPETKPDWAAELYDSFQSGASGQFILYGNVHDRLAIGGRLVSIERYIEDERWGEITRANQRLRDLG